MRSRFFLGLLGLLSLGIAVSWATSSMLAQKMGRAQRRQSQVAETQLPGHGTFTIRQLDPPADPPSPPLVLPDLTNAIPGTIPASYLRKSFSVESQGWDVVVNASLDMKDTIEGNQYFWAMRVYDQDREDVLLAQRIYLDQMFTVPIEEGLSPTFNEHVRLAPGNYRVFVSVHRILPTDQADLNDWEWMDGHKVFWFGEKLTISPIQKP